MRWSRAWAAAAAVAAMVVGSFGGWWIAEQRRLANPEARVVEVIDGDTVVVSFVDGTRDTIRLLGVDTPETHHPSRPVECFGPEAEAFTRAALTGRTVRLERDVELRDRYGRRLAYLYVGGVRFNDVLLRDGYARLLVIDPNHAHARTMVREEIAAERAGRGLWQAC
jgi:micrococcal nuclease